MIKDYRRRENYWIIQTSNITFCKHSYVYWIFTFIFNL